VRDGPSPFKSRVRIDEGLGLNPTKKILLLPAKNIQKNRSANALAAHKAYLKSLQDKKQHERNSKYDKL
jgi:hypothetical protein